MADMSAENKLEADRFAQPAEEECEILKGNEVREEALNAKKHVEESKAPVEEKLPKLSMADFRVYNSMAEHMEYFHEHFRHSWTMLHNACTENKRPAGMSLRQFLQTGIQFCSHLSTHHAIEEQHIFPVLATKMPEFKQGKNAAELLRQHKAIHAGMDIFEEYLTSVKNGEADFDLRVLKEKMDSWGEVLWKHLDQEVKTLAAENMRKYWTLDEMRRMPM